LASAKVNLELAGTEFHRMEELFKDKIVSERVYDQAKASRDRLQNEVENLTKLVDESEKNFEALQLTNGNNLSVVSVDPLRAAIAVQESKLHLTEAELSPITMTAPIDGIVSTIFHRAGESITAGQPIVAVATLNPVRTVGSARVIEVGTQLEAVPATLLGAMKAATELGLPVEISLPSTLKIRAGELVDIVLLSKAE
jgi:multidrug resistance efflux pump